MSSSKGKLGHRDRHAQREGIFKPRRAKGVSKLQELEEAEKNPPLEPSQGAPACPHLDFRRPHSSAETESISGVPHPVDGTQLWWPWDTNAFRRVGVLADAFKPFL